MKTAMGSAVPDLTEIHGDIVAAAGRLRGIAVRTPLLECPATLTQ